MKLEKFIMEKCGVIDEDFAYVLAAALRRNKKILKEFKINAEEGKIKFINNVIKNNYDRISTFYIEYVKQEYPNDMHVLHINIMYIMNDKYYKKTGYLTYSKKFFIREDGYIISF